MLGLIKMITDGFKAVYIVDATDLLSAAEAILKGRLPDLEESQLIHYLHVVVMKGLEQNGLGQTNVKRYVASVGDRHWAAITIATNTIGAGLWQLFQRLGVNGWVWFDRLKIVGKRELWLCWSS